jgi:hypothetical protein
MSDMTLSKFAVLVLGAALLPLSGCSSSDNGGGGDGGVQGNSDASDSSSPSSITDAAHVATDATAGSGTDGSVDSSMPVADGEANPPDDAEVDVDAGSPCSASVSINNVFFYGPIDAGTLTSTVCPSVAPSTDVILESSYATNDAGTTIFGTSPNAWGVYKFEATGEQTASTTPGTGTLAVAANVVPPGNYVGAGLFYNSASCINASDYTGVVFTIAGDLGSCTVQFSVEDSEHASTTLNTVRGTCTASSCIQPFYTVTQVGTYMVPFADLLDGSPATPFDPAAILGVQWDFIRVATSPVDAGTGEAGILDSGVRDSGAVDAADAGGDSSLVVDAGPE